MLLPVLLLLSFSTVQCRECEREIFENTKSTIDSNLNGFRTVFPIDYTVEHHYKDSMLCTDRCCVFPAAVILSDSWQKLLNNLWKEHLNHSFILDIKQTLDKIIEINIHMERFQEKTDIERLPSVYSPPEELLNLTSQLLSKWLSVVCESSIATCPIPSLAPAADDWIHTPPRARLLTTREVHSPGPIHSKVDHHHSNGGAPSLTLPDVSAWILLLWGWHLLL